MENAEKAVMMAFAVFVLAVALTISMYLFSVVTETAETLSLYADSTVYYDNVQIDEDAFDPTTDEHIRNGTVRIVGAETIIPTLYRYYKENFCVKIYGATGNLIQIFDVNLEGNVNRALGDTNAKSDASEPKHVENYAYNMVYNVEDSSKPYYLFGAPWLGSTESVKTRVDYFIDGEAGYINNTYVNYRDNEFYQARIAGKQFTERFISYSYSGQTMITEDGDRLTTGEKSKDKVIIIYTLIN